MKKILLFLILSVNVQIIYNTYNIIYYISIIPYR